MSWLFQYGGGDGFEPSKAEPADLQSAPFGHSGTLQGIFILRKCFPNPAFQVFSYDIIIRKNMVEGTDSNHRRRSRQIYSLLPLATREPSRVFLYLESVFPTRLSKCFLMIKSQERIWWRGRIRTIEGGAGRFTVCSLWLGNPSRVFLYLESVFPTRLSKCFLMTQSQERIWWRGRIRTIEGGAGRFTVCSLWPLEPPGIFILRKCFPNTVFQVFSHDKITRKNMVEGTDSNHRRRSRQIYSLLPLATREPLQGVFILRKCFPNTAFQVFSHDKITRKNMVEGTDSNHRRRSRQIYSLLPLATREPSRVFYT